MNSSSILNDADELSLRCDFRTPIKLLFSGRKIESDPVVGRLGGPARSDILLSLHSQYRRKKSPLQSVLRAPPCPEFPNGRWLRLRVRLRRRIRGHYRDRSS